MGHVLFVVLFVAWPGLCTNLPERFNSGKISEVGSCKDYDDYIEDGTVPRSVVYIIFADRVSLMALRCLALLQLKQSPVYHVVLALCFHLLNM